LEAEAPFYPWFPLESREKKNSSSWRTNIESLTTPL
jgi:hypothetical protein